ncbi:MAG TPA: serine/threonine-protein kinase [Kofleriaceae bacterium]|jgi:serine/threonine-protein kinase
MSRRSDSLRDEPSDPEISVSAVIQSQAEEFRDCTIVGERFGRYQLVGEIAVGGMAEVFLAVHNGLEGFIKVVVIKRVLPHFSGHEEFVRMFVNEARLVTRLEHPNIVRTYEFGEVNGQYFTAMEYLPAEELGKVLNNLVISRQAMPHHVAAGIASQLCTGLHFAHQFPDVDGQPLNLVHRDINPVNILITYGGEVKIIDFGVAKSNANRQTVTGTIKGKVAYMPPEQILGRSVDHRADIFSAGVVLWEMLTGRPLFLRDNEAATLYAIMNSPIPAPSKLRPGVPPQLDRIVARALSRTPGDRYATAEDMAAALDELLVDLPRFDTRVLSRMMEELFGSTRAEAKRAIAQTRSLARNVSLVMKLRSDLRTNLAEQLEAAAVAAVAADHLEDETRPHRSTDRGAAVAPAVAPALAPGRRPLRGWVLALAALMIAGMAAGLAYTLSRPSTARVAARAVQASLQIDSVPAGAAVFVDGEPTGLKTPTVLSGISARQLSIRLELVGHVPVTETVDLRAGALTARRVTLPPLSGRLVISDLPADASVFVDDDEHAAGELITAAAGPHVVRVVIDRRTVTQQSVDVGPGDQRWRLVRGRLVPD